MGGIWEGDAGGEGGGRFWEICSRYLPLPHPCTVASVRGVTGAAVISAILPHTNVRPARTRALPVPDASGGVCGIGACASRRPRTCQCLGRWLSGS